MQTPFAPAVNEIMQNVGTVVLCVGGAVIESYRILINSAKARGFFCMLMFLTPEKISTLMLQQQILCSLQLILYTFLFSWLLLQPQK